MENIFKKIFKQKFEKLMLSPNKADLKINLEYTGKETSQYLWNLYARYKNLKTLDISILPKTFDEFCLEIHIDNHNSTITSDKLILLEKQLRLIDNYFSMNEIEKLNLAEDLSNYVWIPCIDFHQMFEIGRTCIDKFTPSIKISRNRLDTNVNALNVIACPVNEFCFDKNFNNSQIIIIEQDSINTEAITYELGEAKVIINGRILFAVSKAQYN